MLNKFESSHFPPVKSQQAQIYGFITDDNFRCDYNTAAVTGRQSDALQQNHLVISINNAMSAKFHLASLEQWN